MFKMFNNLIPFRNISEIFEWYKTELWDLSTLLQNSSYDSLVCTYKFEIDEEVRKYFEKARIIIY